MRSCRHVPELASSRDAGVVAGHAARDQALGGGVEVLAHLGLHVIVEGIRAQGSAKAADAAQERLNEHGSLDGLVGHWVSAAWTIRD